MVERNVVRLLMSLGILLLGACSDGAEEPEGPPTWVTDLFPAMALGWELVPEGQKAMLADGDMTFAELEAANLAAVACLEEEGYGLRDQPRYDEISKSFVWSINGGSTQADGFAADAAMERCWDLHVNHVQVVWGLLDSTTEEQRQASRAAYEECLDEAGVDDVPPVGSKEFFAWLADDANPSERVSCIDQAAREHDASPF